MAKVESSERDRGLWRDLTAYWIFGLCNNYGYVVMLSAAHDIIAEFENSPVNDIAVATSSERNCHMISTGAILLADIIPSLLVKTIMPFLPLWPKLRIHLAIVLGSSGFILVAFANAAWLAIFGVILTSASSGLGETTFMAYSFNFNKNVISTWSSGTGGAGVIGSISYASLRALNVSSRNTMLIMLIFPLVEALSFWYLLRKPFVTISSNEQAVCTTTDERNLTSLHDKFIYIKHLIKYMLPLTMVYFFEYFINQGLFELVYFGNSFLDKQAQYRWLNVNYQIGVFISRSSVNICHFKRIWIMSLLQLLNVIYFYTEVIYFYTPNIWICFIIVLWEGLLGGSAYVNTFYRMSQKIAPARQEFAMSIVVQSDAFGIALAGFLAIPVHNAICAMPIRQ